MCKPIIELAVFVSLSILLCCSNSSAQAAMSVPRSCLSERPSATASNLPDVRTYPEIGRHALLAHNCNAYLAVDSLMPKAAKGDVNAVISVAQIMLDRLNGHLTGSSREPFTWRENWVWWHIAAYESWYTAQFLGTSYRLGERGLPKNEGLGRCLETVSVERTRADVHLCFERFE
jgi:hypothetical protein